MLTISNHVYDFKVTILVENFELKISILGGWPSGQWQQTVNLSTKVYVGSNPSPPTILYINKILIFAMY